MSARGQELDSQPKEAGVDDVLIFSYGSTPRGPSPRLPLSTPLSWGTRRARTATGAATVSDDDDDASSSSDTLTSSSYSSESEWEASAAGGEPASPPVQTSFSPSTRTRQGQESRRASRQQKRLSLFLDTTVGCSGDIVRRLSPRPAQDSGTFALLGRGASPSTPLSGKQRTLSLDVYASTVADTTRNEIGSRTALSAAATSIKTNDTQSAQCTSEQRGHVSATGYPSRRERARPPPIETRFENESNGNVTETYTSLLPLQHLALGERILQTPSPGMPQRPTTPSSVFTSSEPSSRSGSESTPPGVWTPGRMGWRPETVTESSYRWLATCWGPGEVLLPMIRRAGGDDTQSVPAVIYAYPRLPTMPMLAGAWSVSSSSSSTISPRGAMSPSPRRSETQGPLSSRRWWSLSSTGTHFMQTFGLSSRTGLRGDVPRLPWTCTPRAATTPSLGALASPMPGHQHVRLASERLGEVLATILSTDAALREDDSIRNLFLLFSDGTASPANVFIHLRFERGLAERIRRAEGAAFRAVLVVLHLLLEGPLEALAEAVANGMLDYWQTLYRLWSERLPNAESMSEAEAAEHWRTIFLVEVIDYLTRKLRFHESYPVFEANYSLGRFLRRVDLEAVDSARAAENRETMQRVFSLDTVTEMVSILHRLLDAELGLARHVGQLDSKAPPNSRTEANESHEAPETRAVFQLYREPTLLRSLLSLLASDATSLYQMIVYMMSRMYEQIGRRGGTGNTRSEEIAELRELAVVLQEMGVFLRKFFERLLDADLIEEVPHIPSQLLMPAPDASMVASRFPFLIVGRFTTFDCLHRAIAAGTGLEAPERLRSS